MKRYILTFLLFAFSLMGFAESVKPTFGVETSRVLSYAEINGQKYSDVTVEVNAAPLGDLFVNGVKIVVYDNKTGKRIYKKRFSSSLLYAFSDGTIQIGKGNALTNASIYKVKGTNVWEMQLRDKGIY